jgi:DNA-directed RNA polymerase specialized sigma24 family protein
MPGPHIDITVYDNEAALLEGLRAGEPDACTCLVKRFAPLVYAKALHMVADPDEAEGVLQLTFIKACEKLSTFEGRSGLGTWLYRIAMNEALMQLRRGHAAFATLDTLDETIQPADLPQNLQAWPIDPARRRATGDRGGRKGETAMINLIWSAWRPLYQCWLSRTVPNAPRLYRIRRGRRDDLDEPDQCGRHDHQEAHGYIAWCLCRGDAVSRSTQQGQHCGRCVI